MARRRARRQASKEASMCKTSGPRAHVASLDWMDPHNDRGPGDTRGKRMADRHTG